MKRVYFCEPLFFLPLGSVLRAMRRGWDLRRHVDIADEVVPGLKEVIGQAPPVAVPTLRRYFNGDRVCRSATSKLDGYWSRAARHIGLRRISATKRHPRPEKELYAAVWMQAHLTAFSGNDHAAFSSAQNQVRDLASLETTLFYKLRNSSQDTKGIISGIVGSDLAAIVVPPAFRRHGEAVIRSAKTGEAAGGLEKHVRAWFVSGRIGLLLHYLAVWDIAWVRYCRGDESKISLIRPILPSQGSAGSYRALDILIESWVRDFKRGTRYKLFVGEGSVECAFRRRLSEIHTGTSFPKLETGKRIVERLSDDPGVRERLLIRWRFASLLQNLWDLAKRESFTKDERLAVFCDFHRHREALSFDFGCSRPCGGSGGDAGSKATDCYASATSPGHGP